MSWTDLTPDERLLLIQRCAREGHDYRYIRGSAYQWDCARCNWQEHRFRPTLPLEPSMSVPRFQIVENW